MANNGGFKFIFQQRTAKTAPQPQPSDTLLGTVRTLMRDGKWLVKPGERPELRNTGSAARSSSE
jgi:hypothetical protein